MPTTSVIAKTPETAGHAHHFRDCQDAGDSKSSFDDRLIVALDLPSAGEALDMVDRIGNRSRFYKLGLGMVARDGFELAAELSLRRRKRLFLDMKLFDIGSIVASAVTGLLHLEPDLLTVHGDPHVVRAAALARAGAPTRILAVTVLTSLARHDLDDSLTRKGTVAKIAAQRAERAFDAGADGVICSALEAPAIRSMAEDKLIVTPGIRPAGSRLHDQARIATPAEALTAGVDHMVIGRPIITAANPAQAVSDINNELASAPPST